MKVLTGKVVSAKMLNTIVVEVGKQRLHPLYKKIMRRSKKYKVHNENQAIKEGDMVNIVSTRPISKDKHYKVLSKV